MDKNNSSHYFLGLDLSTQSLKLCILDQQSRQVYHQKINFQDIISQNQPVIHFSVENEQTCAEQDVFLFIQALEIGLKALNDQFKQKISAISISGQQHGSVYFSKQIEYDIQKELKDNLFSTFSTKLCPIWMDSSTSNQCKEMEQIFPQILQKTGSRPFERFTYSQILKKYQKQREIYDQTIHISLISSFVAELLIGNFTSIDFGDASGMNLMDLQQKKYIKDMIDFIPNLENKLGQFQPIESWKKLNNIHKYFISKYSQIFDQNCMIIASTGDNLASKVGMGLLNSNDLAISLGTSDTLFGIINEEEIQKSLNPNTPIFSSPLSYTQYLLLLCQKNGGIMRNEMIKNNNLTWQQVEDYYVNSYQPNGFYGCFLQQPEIVPAINCRNQISEIRNLNENQSIEDLSAIEKIILMLEYKIISLKINYSDEQKKFDRLILTGGACKNKILQQISSNVFNCAVFIQDSEDSAAIGSALRAHHGYLCQKSDKLENFQSIFKDCNAYSLQEVAKPQQKMFEFYQTIEPRVKQLEKQLQTQHPY